MTKEQLIELLKRYRFNQSVLALAQRNIRDIRDGIKSRMTDEVIESLAVGGTKFEDMPPSITNKFNSLTENAALGYEDRMIAENREALERIRQFESDTMSIKADIEMVDDLMKALQDESRIVIRLIFIEDLPRPKVCTFYCRKYGLSNVDTSTIERKKNEGINVMLKAYKHARI